MFNATKVNVKSSATNQNTEGHREEVAPSLSFGTQESNVRVIIQVRPLVIRELGLKSQVCIEFKDKDSVVAHGDPKIQQQVKQFTFDCVLTNKNEQSEVFESGPKSIVEKSLQGYNGCVFVYEQTGSGKNVCNTQRTDNGKAIIDNKNTYCVIFQSVQYIYEHISANKDKKKCALSLTFLEIYNKN
ncbi:hypothetical protein RFI_32955 [Reticulomyxa filosa]|uniref:Kinesin motor domain-containing protein n=1 Tax=Reticulomyxa filosa TaxID=46433 RepID=X6LTL8_RETFI|nr:hypothetical protein RFI_32955 [Reticulomyxa filosa]|eukprot:ETO04442.1 hypothetical protein RFI_32955 [Reticulomyxa filosa]